MTTTSNAKVSHRGQTSLPAELRHRWGIDGGGEVGFIDLGAAALIVPGGVAAPSEIAAGVPRDLDAICRLTLNDDQGPTSPGDFARQVAPWPSRQVIGRPVMPAAPAAAPAAVAAPTAVPSAAPADPARTTQGAEGAGTAPQPEPRPEANGGVAARATAATTAAATTAGATAAGAAIDVARAVARRAERCAVRLANEDGLPNAEVVRYLNRLSDLLWLLGRRYEIERGVDSALRA